MEVPNKLTAAGAHELAISSLRPGVHLEKETE
jgi:hypothetical protein